MTTITKLYRLRVMDAGSDYGDAYVAHTFSAELIDTPTVGAQTVRPLDCNTVTQPWSVTLLDDGDALTAKLPDAAGRAQLIGRIADLQVSTDAGSNYSTLAVGRVDEIQMSSGAGYVFSISDERLIERQTTIFTSANTTMAWPPGFVSRAWGPFLNLEMRPQYSDVKRFYVGYDRAFRIGPCTFLRFDPTLSYDELPRELVDAIESDRKATVTDRVTPSNVSAGSFDTLRLKVSTGISTPSTDYQIVAFLPSTIFGLVLTSTKLECPPRGSDMLADGLTGAWVYDPAEAIGLGAAGNCYMYFGGAEPTKALPLHIDDTHPVQVLKDIYDGDYQSGTAQTVRYDSTAMAALIADERYGTVRFRVTEPANMATWLEDNIYKPHRLVPLIGPDGELVPTFVGSPDASAVPDPSSLFEFTDANSTLQAWRVNGQEQVTQLDFRYWQDTQVTIEQLSDGGGALDGIDEVERDRAEQASGYTDGTFALRRHSVKLEGVRQVGEATGAVEAFTGEMAGHVFDRFETGPVYYTIEGLSATSGVAVGDYVLVSASILPNLGTGARGGSRMVQVLSRTVTPATYVFECMEIGPESAVLVAPTLTATQHGAYPETTIRLTISGVPAGAEYELQRAASVSEPAADSALWRTFRVGTATPLDVRLWSGQQFWFRGRSRRAGRVSSAWSTAVTATTATYTAPSGIAVVSVTATTALVEWTLGETDLRVELLLDGTRVKILPPGTTQFRLTGLTASTTYNSPGVAVRHIDSWQGTTTSSTTTFTTSATKGTLPTPELLTVVVGDAATRTVAS